MRVALLLSSALALAPASAHADSVYLKSGHVLEGVASVDGDKVDIALEGGRVSVPLADVTRIERGTPALQIVEERERTLPASDIEGTLKLANYCREHDLLGKERALLERLLTVYPEHAEARRRLGFVRTPEGWATSAALARRREQERDERELSKLMLQKKRAEAEREAEKLRAERAENAQKQRQLVESRARQQHDLPDPYYAPYGTLTPQARAYGWGGPPPYYVGSPAPVRSGAPPSPHRSFSINGVRAPSSYFDDAFKR